LREADTHIERLSASLQAAETRASEARRELAEERAVHARSVAELTARATTVERDSLELSSRSEHAQGQAAEAEARATALAQRSRELETEIESAGLEIAHLRDALAMRSADGDALAAQVRNMAAESEALRAALRRAAAAHVAATTRDGASDAVAQTTSATGQQSPIRPLPQAAAAAGTAAESRQQQLLPEMRTETPFDKAAAELPDEGRVEFAPPLERLPIASVAPPRSSLGAGTALGTGTAPVVPTSVSAAIKLNHRRVWAALSGVLWAAPGHADKLAAARLVLTAHPQQLLLIGLVSSTSAGTATAQMVCVGLYAAQDSHSRPSVSITATAGERQRQVLATCVLPNGGPEHLRALMVHQHFKFDTAARVFSEVGHAYLLAFSPTVDAVAIDSSWAAMARRDKAAAALASMAGVGGVV
jgi:hypothetical protein